MRLDEYLSQYGFNVGGEQPTQVSSQGVPQDARSAIIGYDKSGKPQYDPIKLEGLKNSMQPSMQEKVQVQADTKRAKDIQSMALDVERADAALGNTFKGWLDNISWNYDTYGLKPGGIVGGLASKLAGATRTNPFWEGFYGSTLEYGAAVARIAMPGIRASRVIDTFKQTAPTDWSTVESGVYNTAISFRGAISKDLATHPEDYKDLLGKDFDKLSKVEKSQRKREVLDKIQDQYEIGLYKAIYKVEPGLFRDKKIIKRLESMKKLDSLGLDSSKFELVD